MRPRQREVRERERGDRCQRHSTVVSSPCGKLIGAETLDIEPASSNQGPSSPVLDLTLPSRLGLTESDDPSPFPSLGNTDPERNEGANSRSPNCSFHLALAGANHFQQNPASCMLQPEVPHKAGFSLLPLSPGKRRVQVRPLRIRRSCFLPGPGRNKPANLL